VNVVEKIATTLGETDKSPLATIDRMVKVLGEEKSLAILEEALKIEAGEGMLTDNKSRRRTVGGTFFKLTKNQTTSQERGKIFGPPPRARPKPEIIPITWEESEALSIEALKLPRGEAEKVKLTIIGRPGRLVEKEAVVITTMQSSKAPSLPKGLPQPPGDPTTYIVYIATKQWRKVKKSIKQNPEDKLIIEGYPIFDKRIGQTGAMTIYAQSVTTTMIQQAKREAQRAAAKQE
jgi:hypothetical protein